MRKIAIVGTSGSGKTYFAKRLSKKLGIEHFELDNYYWQPEWAQVPIDDFKKSLIEITKNPTWIVCGNYSKFRKEIFSDLDTVFWLDFPLSTCLIQSLKRALSHIWHKTPTCNGNVETLRRLFLSKKSILLWVLTTHKKRRQTYLKLMNDPELADINWVTFKSKDDIAKHLDTL